jgi:hypothetical protein
MEWNGEAPAFDEAPAFGDQPEFAEADTPVVTPTLPPPAITLSAIRTSTPAAAVAAK